jgi:hypothetical protein
MLRVLRDFAAVMMLAATTVPGVAAADKRESAIEKQAVGEEFTSQRRYHRAYYVRRYWPVYGYCYRRYYFGAYLPYYPSCVGRAYWDAHPRWW